MYGSILLLFGLIILFNGLLIIYALKKHFNQFYHQYFCQLLIANLFISVPLILISILRIVVSLHEVGDIFNDNWKYAAIYDTVTVIVGTIIPLWA